MVFPTPPQTVASFFDAHPPSQSEVGAQFDELKRSISEILGFLKTFVRDDGKIRDDSLAKEQISVEISEKAAETLENAVLALETGVSNARSASFDAHAVLDQVEALKNEILSAQSSIFEVYAQIREKIGFFDRFVAPHMSQIEPRAAPPTDYTGVLYPQAGGFYGVDAQGATAVAQDYAQVSIEWAEHMPDTIPPNILAVNAITGQHWSSRWWAMHAAGIVGGAFTWLYLPPSATAPVTDPNGNPIQTGAVYYNTTTQMMYVWNGSSWQSIETPQPSWTSSLFYKSAANQTAFPTTTPDLGGRTVTLKPDGSQGIATHMNGVRLVPDDGSGNVGDYQVNAATSTITLLKPSQVGFIVIIDILTPSSQLAPGAVLIKKLNPITPDGTTTVFTVTATDSTTVAIKGSTEILLSLDGVEQEPGVNFTASGNQITFAVAPRADSYLFAQWFMSAGAS